MTDAPSFDGTIASAMRPKFKKVTIQMRPEDYDRLVEAAERDQRPVAYQALFYVLAGAAWRDAHDLIVAVHREQEEEGLRIVAEAEGRSVQGVVEEFGDGAPIDRGERVGGFDEPDPRTDDQLFDIPPFLRRD